MKIKIIRNKQDHREAVQYLETALENEKGQSSRDEIDTLALLIEQFEKEMFPLPMPDPVQAIMFRMEQKDLSPRDLVQYIGSRSKVSEVLSGKRSLSVNMIRALHDGLGIPAEILISTPTAPRPNPIHSGDKENESDVKWDEYPLQEMQSRGYFDRLVDLKFLGSKTPDLASCAADIMREWMRPLKITAPLAAPALCKKTLTTRAARAINPYALSAWSMRVLLLAGNTPPAVTFERGVLTDEFLSQVARLSLLDRGPVLAQEFLFKHGISLIIEPHLPRTHLDGAAIAFWREHPVIGLTLRYDRVDNFWFCLLHELAHLKRHFWDEKGDFVPEQFYDDMDAETVDPREKEADAIAGEALIPYEAWRKSPVSVLPSPQAAEKLARELGIHPAIVAGRVRHEKNSFRLLNNLVGQGEVRKHFSHILWKGEKD
jgi:HTH-type transcriptional regulator/antitoxin HigA